MWPASTGNFSIAILVSSPQTCVTSSKTPTVSPKSGPESTLYSLGTFLHMVRSYIDFISNRTLRGSWSAWYLLYSFIGAALALIVYIAVRGGLLTTGMEVNPYGIAALATIVGI